MFFVFVAECLPHSLVWAAPQDAQNEKRVEAFHTTKLPLPRFVSLGEDQVYVRAGPDQKYPIKWVYVRKNYPVEIILEYGNWRKVRDVDGDEGWIFHSLLSGRRHALIRQGDSAYAPVYKYASGTSGSRMVAKLEPRVVVGLHGCQGIWCDVEASGYRGWVQRKYLWGVYEGENFD
ncbi:MAG: SH3 domain-containing protein [Alphaproteobacteria bacterium]|nr:SH3 domain-containing protein [Alphaproteobacteria bacterium]